VKKHILCIGDSNTHGLCTDPSESADHSSRYNEEERWTCLLQKALGAEYLVIEEGLSGRTCVYDDPDMDSVNLLPVLHALLNSHEPLDLLILMLGTNDSKVKFNTDARKIAKGMQILLEEAKSVPCWGKNGPKILIVAPVPIEEGVIYPDFNEKSVETTRALAREYAFLAVAERADFLDAGGCELTKADHVHLTAKGHRQLAERMETAVRDILGKTVPEAVEERKDGDGMEEIVTAKEADVLHNYGKYFAELGFEIEAFGGNEYALRSVPVDLYGCSERELFLAVLDELSQETGNRGSFQVIEEKIASMSCKAAVKGNNRLSLQEAEQLIDELLTLDNPYNCPHGRPTIITMTETDLEKKFKRIV